MTVARRVTGPATADNQCECPDDGSCECNSVFCGPCFDPDSTEAKDHARDHINNCSLKKSILTWFLELVTMHAFFCDMPTSCSGVPSVDKLIDEPFEPAENDCVYANESRWALTGINFGFRPFSSKPAARTPDNYPAAKLSQHISPDIKHEYKQSWLRMLVSSMFTSPMFVKDECSSDEEKYRVIKNFSDKPHD